MVQIYELALDTIEDIRGKSGLFKKREDVDITIYDWGMGHGRWSDGVMERGMSKKEQEGG